MQQKPIKRPDVWPLKEAKAHLSEVVERALAKPQRITRRGKEAVVVLAEAEYRKMTKPKHKETLVEFLSHTGFAKLDLRRSRQLPRKVDFD